MEIITVEQMNNACDKEYKENYSHGGYCHEQSFRFGFQEGVEYTENKVKEIMIDKAKMCFKDTFSCFGEIFPKELMNEFLKKLADIKIE